MTNTFIYLHKFDKQKGNTSSSFPAFNHWPSHFFSVHWKSSTWQNKSSSIWVFKFAEITVEFGYFNDLEVKRYFAQKIVLLLASYFHILGNNNKQIIAF